MCKEFGQIKQFPQRLKVEKVGPESWHGGTKDYLQVDMQINTLGIKQYGVYKQMFAYLSWK